VPLFLKAVFPAGIAGIQNTGRYLRSPSMGLDTRFLAGMTYFSNSDAHQISNSSFELAIHLYLGMLTKSFLRDQPTL